MEDGIVKLNSIFIWVFKCLELSLGLHKEVVRAEYVELICEVFDHFRSLISFTVQSESNIVWTSVTFTSPAMYD